MEKENYRIRKSQGLYYIEVQCDAIDRSSFWNIIRGKTIKKWTRASTEGVAVVYGMRDTEDMSLDYLCEPFNTQAQAEDKINKWCTPDEIIYLNEQG